jgi:hypothetical protein
MKQIFTLIMIIIYTTCFSQEKDSIVIPDISKELVVFIDSLDNTNKNYKQLSDEDLSLWWADIIAISKSDSYSNYLKYRTKAIKSVHGLRLIAHYNNNFGNAIDEDEDFSYSSKVYTGLEWEFLRNGLLNSLNRAKKSKIENKYKEIEHNRLVLKQQEKIGNLIINKTINSIKKESLIDILVIEQKINYLYRLLSYEKHFTKQNLLNRLGEEYSTRNQLKNIITDDTIHNSSYHLPLLEINIDSIKYYQNINSNDSILLTNKIKAINTSNYIFENWSLKPVVKYNIINRVDGSTKKYTSLGISLSLPLATGRNLRKSRRYKISDLKENNYLVKSKKDEIILSYINNAITYNNQLFKAIRNRESLNIKINSIRNRIQISPSTLSGLEFLEVLSAKRKTDIAILDINKDIYENILNISIALDGINPSTFCNTIDQNSIYKRNNDQRYIYIWSKFVGNTSSEKMYSFLQEADIQNAIISFNNGENSYKYLEYLNKKNIKTTLLIGNNSILDKDSLYIRKYIKDKLQFPVNGINLDIEPHAVEKWKNRKQEYYKKLIEIYSIAREECDIENKTLGVSIPVFYSKDFLTRIKPLCDKVFIMAYETANPNVIVKNIKQELEIIGTDALVIVINNKDFKTPIERELVIDAIIKHTKCTNIGYHKAETLFHLNNN